MKNKKVLIGLIILMVVSVVGLTIAFFTDTVEIPNVFKTNVFKTKVTEEFVSPDNWLPGTTTSKTVKVDNLGNVPVAVRISYTESWVAKDGTTLSGVQNGNRAAIINFVNTSDWIQSGNYYYYKTKLTKNQSSKNFIESVTFNTAIDDDASCTESSSGNVTESICESSESGYGGATYTLTFTVETCQFDSYKDIWNTTFEIE